MPPVATMLMVPLDNPKQVTLEKLLLAIVGAASLLIAAVPEMVQPFASVTNRPYGPAGSELKDDVLWNVVPELML